MPVGHLKVGVVWCTTIGTETGVNLDSSRSADKTESWQNPRIKAEHSIY